MVQAREIEDRRYLDTYNDISEEEKELMLLWNSFVERNRIYADSYVRYACKQFTQVNREWLAKTPERRRCFLLHLLNLSDFALVDGETISCCLRLVRAVAASAVAAAAADFVCWSAIGEGLGAGCPRLDR